MTWGPSGGLWDTGTEDPSHLPLPVAATALGKGAGGGQEVLPAQEGGELSPASRGAGATAPAELREDGSTLQRLRGEGLSSASWQCPRASEWAGAGPRGSCHQLRVVLAGGSAGPSEPSRLPGALVPESAL